MPRFDDPQQQLKSDHSDLVVHKQKGHCEVFTLYAQKQLLTNLPPNTRLPLTPQHLVNFEGHMQAATDRFIRDHCQGFEERLAKPLEARNDSDRPKKQDDSWQPMGMETFLRERVRAFLDAVNQIPVGMPSRAAIRWAEMH